MTERDSLSERDYLTGHFRENKTLLSERDSLSERDYLTGTGHFRENKTLLTERDSLSERDHLMKRFLLSEFVFLKEVDILNEMIVVF